MLKKSQAVRKQGGVPSKLWAPALGLTAFQILLALWFAPAVTPQAPETYSGTLEVPQGWVWHTTPYARLLNWDSYHFYEIAARGYHSEQPFRAESVHQFKSSGPFFPLFPWVARAVAKVTFLDLGLALVVTAQLFCFVFWFFFLLACRRLDVPRWATAVAVLAVLSYPSTFFLVAAYSESAFCAALLGFFVLVRNPRSASDRRGALVSAAGIGLARVFGIAFVIYPALVLFLERGAKGVWKNRRQWFLPLAITTACTLGFFVLLDWKLGMPFSYFKLQKAAYSHSVDLWAVFDPRLYMPRFFRETFAVSFNRICAGFLVIMSIGSVIGFRKSPDALAKALLLCLGTLISIATKAHSNLDGVARYSLPIYLLFILGFLELRPWRVTGWRRRIGLSVISLCLVVFFSLHVWTAMRFLKGKWIT